MRGWRRTPCARAAGGMTTSPLHDAPRAPSGALVTSFREPQQKSRPFPTILHAHEQLVQFGTRVAPRPYERRGVHRYATLRLSDARYLISMLQASYRAPLALRRPLARAETISDRSLPMRATPGRGHAEPLFYFTQRIDPRCRRALSPSTLICAASRLSFGRLIAPPLRRTAPSPKVRLCRFPQNLREPHSSAPHFFIHSATTTHTTTSG